MGLIKTDNKTYRLKNGSEPCMKGAKDCIYANSTSGGCYAEWCIFDQLPVIENTSKELTCMVCNENKTTVSVYSGKTDFICEDCKEKISKLIKETNCAICGAEIKGGQSICSYCASQIREKIYNESTD